MLLVARNAQRLQQASRFLVRTMSTPAATLSSSTSPSLSCTTPLTTSATPTSHSSSICPPTQNVPPIPIPRRGVDYRRKIVLAPMVRSGELPSRLLALHYTADLVWGPETVDRSMIGTHESRNPRTGCIEWHRPQNTHAHSSIADPSKENLIFRIDPARESRQFIFQIGTNSPERAVAAAKLVAPHCAGIDVNAGCPKPFSTDGGMGAALLTEENGDLLARILTALVQEVGKQHQIGISVKIRLLSTPEETSALVHKLCRTGITGLTIHCRTRPMRPRERAIREQLRMIGDICRSHGVACLMNGDVTSRDDGLRLAEEYGVDGAMIATAAEANSSVFLSEAEGGKKTWQEVVRQYMVFAMEVENRWANTKFLLSQLMPGRDPVYQKVVQSKNYTACIEVLGLAVEDGGKMLEAAKKCDAVLGLDTRRPTKADIKKANKAANRAAHEANIARKKGLPPQQQQSQHKRPVEVSVDRDTNQQNKKGRKVSPVRNGVYGEQKGRSPPRRAEIAAENAGFEGVGQGALEVAV